jgi:hypothetical protein
VQDYDKMVSVENTNRTERSIDASGIDNVVKQLGEVGLGASTAPESPGFVKRSKGVYSAYEEKMMAQLKEDSPGLKLSQYKVRGAGSVQRRGSCETDDSGLARGDRKWTRARPSQASPHPTPRVSSRLGVHQQPPRSSTSHVAC